MGLPEYVCNDNGQHMNSDVKLCVCMRARVCVGLCKHTSVATNLLLLANTTCKEERPADST